MTTFSRELMSGVLATRTNRWVSVIGDTAPHVNLHPCSGVNVRVPTNVHVVTISVHMYEPDSSMEGDDCLVASSTSSRPQCQMVSSWIVRPAFWVLTSSVSGQMVSTEALNVQTVTEHQLATDERNGFAPPNPDRSRSSPSAAMRLAGDVIAVYVEATAERPRPGS